MYQHGGSFGLFDEGELRSRIAPGAIRAVSARLRPPDPLELA
jgi:hypothetical protein